MDDGSELLDFGISNSWSNIQRIHVSVNGSVTPMGKTITSSLESHYFPRNILSN